MAFGFGLGITANPPLNNTQRALAILRSYGTNAHVYLPGIGTISALSAGNYTSSDGSTGFSAVDGTAGLVLDAAGSVGSELNTNPGGPFVATTGYSVVGSGGVMALVSGELELTATAGNFPAIRRSITTVVGSTYCVTAVIRRGTTGSNVAISATGSSITSGSTTNTTVTYYFVATVTSTSIDFGIPSAAANGTAYLVSESVREITGTRATQSTAANRPALRRGLYNQALYSNDISNAVYSATAGAAKNSATQVSLPVSGAKLTQSTTAGTSSVGKPWTFAVMVSGSGSLNLWMYDDGGAFPGNGVYFITLTSTPTLYVVNRTHSDATATKIAGQLTTSSSATVDIAGFGLIPGTLTAAQILAEGGIPLTTSAAASNTTGKYSWQFDGVNDSLALGSVPFQINDDFAVVAGFTANVVAASNDVFTNASTSVANSLIKLGLSSTTGFGTFALRDDAGTLESVADNVNLAGTTVVLSGRKVSNTKVLRYNGVQKATSAVTLGATTFNTSTIGAKVSTATSNYHNGSIGPVIAIKGTVSDADLLILERWVSSLTPNGPSF